MSETSLREIPPGAARTDAAVGASDAPSNPTTTTAATTSDAPSREAPRADFEPEDGGVLPSLAAVRRVVVGSTNPVKVAAARAVLAPLIAPGATVEGIAADSGVPDQPWGDEETMRGARTRAAAALAASGADLGVAFEGGVVAEDDGGLRTCAWAAVVDRAGRSAVGGSLAMPLPPPVAALIRDGVELGSAMDAMTNAHNTKQKLGAVGVLTAGLIDRQRAYEVLLVYALARWLGAEYWRDKA